MYVTPTPLKCCISYFVCVNATLAKGQSWV